jgi:hypothetical protein
MINNAIQTKLVTIRGREVMLDRDLADLLNMETKVFNQTIKRNVSFFNTSDCFQLSNDEFLDWRSQFVTSNSDKQGLRRPPYAFTINGIELLKIIFKKPDQMDMLETILLVFDGYCNSNESTDIEVNNQLILYTSCDGEVQFDVQFDGDTVWLTQQQMASLFDSTVPNISMHIDNVFIEKEIEKHPTIKDFLIVQNEGARLVQRFITHYCS